MVPDLRTINVALIPIYPVVPNPYTILGTFLSQTQCFSILDLKDTFFCIPLDPQCQFLLAFEWTEAQEHKQHFTWTVLLQGFRNGPYLSGQALAKDLRDLSLGGKQVIQYVDDLLICSLLKNWDTNMYYKP